MTGSLRFDSLLVPVDFSPPSDSAFQRAASLAGGESPVLIMLHVIDPAQVAFAVAHGWGSEEKVVREMRARAEEQMERCKRTAEGRVEIDAIISEGVPFLEILRKAEDFAVDAIVLGKTGARGAIEKLLFGSTAEKVLRGSQRPVIVLPCAP